MGQQTAHARPCRLINLEGISRHDLGVLNSITLATRQQYGELFPPCGAVAIPPSGVADDWCARYSPRD